MSIQRLANQAAEVSRLRATVAAIERELSRLPPDRANDDPLRPLGLHASFAALVDQLDLGPEPETRPCPECRRIVMRAATRCGHCWKKITPPALDMRAVSIVREEGADHADAGHGRDP